MNGRIFTLMLMAGAVLLSGLLFFSSDYVLHIAIMICITGVLTSSLNVISGFAGQLSLCHGVLFGLGGYCSALLSLGLEVPFLPALALSAIFVTVMATLVIGMPSLRTRGLYFALVGVGFQIIVYMIFIHWVEVTNGPAGIPGIPRAAFFGLSLDSRKAFYPFALVILLVNLLSVYLLVNSRIGLEWRAIQQDELAARSLGINSFKIKLIAFAISAFWAGAAGSLVAHYVGYISPDMFGSAINLGVVLMALAGGMGTVSGPLIGTALFVSLPEILREFELYRMVIFGLSLILLVIFLPQGIVGFFADMDFLKKMSFGKVFGKVVPFPKDQTGAPSFQLSTNFQIGAQNSSRIMEVISAKKYFGGVRAIDGLDLHIDAGEILGLIGPNGSGKTTFFNLISGIFGATGGRMIFLGMDITKKPAHAIAKMGISRTFQNIRLFNALTVFQNVFVGSFLSVRSASSLSFVLRTGRAKRVLEERVKATQEILRFVGIEHLSWVRASSLSYGDQRRLEIARALATEPRLLLLDEPTAGMNPQEREAALVLFKKIRSIGITLVIVEHHMRVIMGICDRVIVLDQGRKISEGTPEVVQNDPNVIQAYLGEKLI